mmetsp:Transcript_21687/g.84527  ORF Transcript_21687/g.84527 Transcript_21687/m.84527 type:complete len:458 (-) Transcript_21687:3019-4392(-)
MPRARRPPPAARRRPPRPRVAGAAWRAPRARRRRSALAWDGQGQRHAAAVRAEGHARRRAIAGLEALAQIAQAEAAIGVGWRLGHRRVAMVADREQQTVAVACSPHADGHAAAVPRDIVLDRVLDRRQQQQRRQPAVARGRIGLDVDDEALRTEARLHQAEKGLHQGQLLAEAVFNALLGHQGLAQQVGELAKQPVGAEHVLVHHRRDQVQRVEQEVGLHLVGQPGELQLGELAAGALQLLRPGGGRLGHPDAARDQAEADVGDRVLAALEDQQRRQRVRVVAHADQRIDPQAQPEHAGDMQAAEDRQRERMRRELLQPGPATQRADQRMHAQGQCTDDADRAELPQEGLPGPRAAGQPVGLQRRRAEQQADDGQQRNIGQAPAAREDGHGCECAVPAAGRAAARPRGRATGPRAQGAVSRAANALCTPSSAVARAVCTCTSASWATRRSCSALSSA